MTPLLIIKTANGFAAVKFEGELPTIDLRNLMCFGELEDSRSYMHDGLLSAVKAHFREPPEQVTLKEAA